MAPSNVNNRRRRSRRPRHPTSNLADRERLPIGTHPTAQQTPIVPHITVVPREEEDDAFLQHEADRPPTPVHRNPSLLAETDGGRDTHGRSSINLDNHQQTTFADMARAGIGPQLGPLRSDHMASQEPAPLSHFVKFTKPRKGRKNLTFGMQDETLAESGDASYGEQTQHIQPMPMPTHLEQYLAPGRNQHALNRHNATIASVSFPVTHQRDTLQAHFADVRATFGRDLPPANILEEMEGQRDGEVRFTIDGGGDVTAHAWSAAQFEWRNVGLLSYRRQTIEGALGVRQLKGQKIGSAGPRNRVEMFLALARRYEDENAVSTISPTNVQPHSGPARVMPAVSLQSPQGYIAASTKWLHPHHERGNVVSMGTVEHGFSSLGTFDASSGPARLPTPEVYQPPENAGSTAKTSFVGSAGAWENSSEYDVASDSNVHYQSPTGYRSKGVMSTANTTFDTGMPSVATTSYGMNARGGSGFAGYPSQEGQSPLNHGNMSTRHGPLDDVAQSVNYEGTGNEADESEDSMKPVHGLFVPGRPVFSVKAPISGHKAMIADQLKPNAVTNNLSSVSNTESGPQDLHRYLFDSSGNVARPFNPTPGHRYKFDGSSEFKSSKNCADKAEVTEHASLQELLHGSIACPDDNPRPIYNKLTDGQVLRPALNLRGPFFVSDGADDDNLSSMDRSSNLLTYGAKQFQQRAARLAETAEKLSEEGQIAPMDKASIRQLAANPLAHIVSQVEMTLSSYSHKATNDDYFRRDFKTPALHLIDPNPANHESLFTKSNSNAEREVVFRGRSHRSDSPAHRHSKLRPYPEAKMSPPSQAGGSLPPARTSSARSSMRSMGFDEQMKRRMREGSSFSMGGW